MTLLDNFLQKSNCILLTSYRIIYTTNHNFGTLLMHKNELKDPLCPFTHTLKDEFIIFSGRRCYWSDQEGRGLVDGPHRRQGRRVPLQLCSTCWWTSKLPLAISTCDSGADLISYASKYGNIWIPKLFKDQIWNGLDFGGSRCSYSYDSGFRTYLFG